LFELLEVMKSHPHWRLDLAGFGGDQARILERASELPNVTWHGRVSYPLALELSYRADVLFATYDPSIPNHRYSSPNKIFEAMMLAKPVIVACDTNMDRIITQADCGLVIPYGDKEALDRALTRISSDPDLKRKLGENARKAYDLTIQVYMRSDYALKN
jgi:glycosyltransferase involved in cell wall biosynthesis